MQSMLLSANQIRTKFLPLRIRSLLICFYGLKCALIEIVHTDFCFLDLLLKADGKLLIYFETLSTPRPRDVN